MACIFSYIVNRIYIAWIGITMATTPPPEPIDLDDLNLDDEDFEEEDDD